MRTNRTGLVLIEEAVQLLRTAPVTVFALYCGGTVPFLLALFNFCVEMSYRRDAGAKCAASAVLVALAYCWMKGLQVFCCRELVRAYTGNVDNWWEPKTMLSIWSRQIAFQPLGLFVKPLAWLLLFPVTYVCSFFQNLTVLGGARRTDIRKSWELARLWPAQSHTVYGLLSLLTLSRFPRPLRRHLFHPVHSQDPARDREFSNTKLYLDLLAGLNHRPGGCCSFYH